MMSNTFNFKRIHVEISNICNVQCSFCPVVDRPNEIMSVDNFKSILKQIHPMTDDVCLHLMGEPLAHPKFKEILEVSNDFGASLQITTNALLLKKYEDLILESRCIRQINFSVQAFKDNFPEKPIEDFLRLIVDFSYRAMERREDLYINYRLWNHGDESFARNEDVIRFLERAFDTTMNRSVDVSHRKSKKILDNKRLYLHFDSRFEWPNINDQMNGNAGTCHGLRNHFGIHADGSVVPCCLDKEADINLGNAFEKEVSEILNSTRALNIKKGFENGHLVEDLCQRCTFINRFKK